MVPAIKDGSNMAPKSNSSDLLWKIIAILATAICGWAQLHSVQINDDIRRLTDDMAKVRESIVFVKEDHAEIKLIRQKIGVMEKEMHHWKMTEDEGPNSIRTHRRLSDGYKD